MKRLLLYTCLCAWGMTSLGTKLRAQVFQDVNSWLDTEVQVLYADSITGYLWAGGPFHISALNHRKSGCGYFDGQQWHVIDTLLSGASLAFASFQGQLYAGGYHGIFIPDTFATGVPFTASMLMRWEDPYMEPVIPWDRSQGAIMKLLVHEEYLYAFGAFDSVGSLPASKAARWDGTTWKALPTLDDYRGSIAEAAFYQGELYVGGNFQGQGSPYLSDVAHLKDGVWQPMEQGLSGPQTWISGMVVYDSLLVVGGRFRKSFGDPAEAVMAWDGQQWLELDQGLWAGQVEEVYVHEGELYAGGVFFIPGDPDMCFLARWDGQHWQRVGYLDNKVLTFASTDSGLYMGGGFNFIGGVPHNKVVRYGPAATPTAVEAMPVGQDWSVSPNPAQGRLLLHNPQGRYLGTLTWLDATGRVLRQERINSDAKTIKLDVSGLAPGLYFLQTDEGRLSLKVLVR